MDLRERAQSILDRAELWARAAERDAPAESLDRLAEELESLTALHAELRSSEPELAVRAALVLEPLLRARGPRDLHLRLLASAAALARPVDPGLACDIQLLRAEALANTYGDPGAAQSDLSELEEASLVGSRRARKHWLEGICAFSRARYAEAERLVSAARVTFAAIGDLTGEASALNTLGNVLAHQGRFEQAETAYRAALVRHERGFDLRKRAVVLQNLARLASESGRHEAATELHARALEASQELGDARVEAMGFTQSALAAHDLGELETAAARYERAVRAFATTGEWRFRGFAQVLCALCALERRELAAARAFIASCEPHDPLTEGLRLAVAGVLAARSGERDAALESFALARSAVAGDPHFEATVNVLEGVLDPGSVPARAEAASETARRSCLVRIAVRMLRAAAGEPGPAALGAGLEIGLDAAWFRQLGALRVNLARRPPLERVLSCLVARHLETPSVPVKADELIGAGWPGERIEKRAALNRLYVAIATLRRAGLGRALITRLDGYMLDRSLPITPQC